MTGEARRYYCAYSLENTDDCWYTWLRACLKYFQGVSMTDGEMRSVVNGLKSGLDNLTQEWGQFLKMEAGRRERDAVVRREKEASDSHKAEVDADSWQRGQGFLSKHGAKLVGVMFAIVTSGLAWYGSQIRSEIQSESRAIGVDEGIKSNSENLETFKNATEMDIGSLQRESVNQTLMMDKGFKRMDEVMVKATRLKEEDLPEYPPEFKTAVDGAKALKLHAEKFGTK